MTNATLEMTTQAPSIDPSRAEAFAARMMQMMNNATLALLTSVGHRTGLFDTLAGQPPATSHEIAARAGLNERYVREWLAAMVTGGLVEYDPEASAYALPGEHAAFLTRAAGPDNLAVMAQYVAVLSSVEDRIVDCFRNGGGVPYTAFHRFHEVMREDSGARMDRDLVDRILPMAPRVPEALERGIDVLEIGCGSGRPSNLLARAFPNSRFLGCDLSPEAIAAARAEAKDWGLSNVRFEVLDLAAFEEREGYDLVLAFDVIHDQADPSGVLRRVYRALRPGGVFLMQDIKGSSYLENNLEHPLASMLYSISCMHCMTVSLANGGAGLGTMWGREKALELLRKAGFSEVRVEEREDDLINDTYILRK